MTTDWNFERPKMTTHIPVASSGIVRCGDGAPREQTEELLSLESEWPDFSEAERVSREACV